MFLSGLILEELFRYVCCTVSSNPNKKFKLLGMATFSTAFPSLLPRVADDLWFKLEKRLDDDAALAKEEEEYAASVCFFRSCM